MTTDDEKRIRVCPYCCEGIDVEASKCKYCKSIVEPLTEGSQGVLMKECPYCISHILSEASQCKHCREVLIPDAEVETMNIEKPVLVKQVEVPRSEKQDNQKGNLAGNIINEGFACFYDNWIYYANELDEGRIYKIHNDGIESMRINENGAKYINVFNEIIYYISSEEDDGIYSVNIDCREQKKIIDGYASNLIVYNNLLHFLLYDPITKKSNLHIADTSGCSLRCVVNDAILYGYDVYHNLIFYINYDDGCSLYRICTDGSERIKLYDGMVNWLAVIDNWIYFTDNELDSINKMLLDGTAHAVLKELDEREEASPYELNITSDWVYYSALLENNKLYKMKADGSEITKMLDLPVGCINIVGDWLFCKKWLSNITIKVRMDGTAASRLDGSNIEDLLKDYQAEQERAKKAEEAKKREEDELNLTETTNDQVNEVNYTPNQSDFPIADPPEKVSAFHRRRFLVEKAVDGLKNLLTGKIDVNIYSGVDLSMEAVKVGIYTPPYENKQFAWEFARVFRVDDHSYVASYDREAEIQQPYIRSVANLSALRSFAWTLLGYLKIYERSLSDVSLNEIIALCDFIENRGFLNYSNEPYFKALCGVADFGSAYIPASIHGPDFARACKLTECQSCGELFQLRDELTSLTETMRKIRDYLDENREKTTEQLSGTLSDVLYAWCSLSLAANETFRIVDGTMNYILELKKGGVEDFRLPYWEGDDIARPALTSLIDRISCFPKADFNGTHFEVDLVGTGYEGRAVHFETMNCGELVELRRNPDNPYDSNAIEVFNSLSESLGHIPSEHASILAPGLDQGLVSIKSAEVLSVTPLSQRSQRAKNPLMTLLVKLTYFDNDDEYSASF